MVGAVDIRNKGGKKYSVHRIFWHPQRRYPTINDIAILMVRKELIFSVRVSPICITDSGHLEGIEGEQVLVVQLCSPIHFILLGFVHGLGVDKQI